MTLTRSQFAKAVGAEEKWVENAARILGHPGKTPRDARWMGFVRLLARDYAMTLSRAAELSGEALRHPPDARAARIGESADGVSAVVLDLARFHSTFGAALSTALHHGGPRRRGRRSGKPSATKRSAVANAEHYGVDVSLLRASMDRSPAERLERLDANASFLSALRPVKKRDGPA